jgi:two-component SAPR family response regulator
MSAWRFATEQYEEDEGGWFGLVTFIAACIGVGVGLWWFTGPPTMFTSVPDWTYIREVLRSSEVGDRDIITVTAGFAWLVIGYVLLSVAIRLLLGAVIAVTGGASWARAALRATSPLTIPVVRRMVDAALAGTILVSATLHTPSTAFASSASMAAVVETRVPAQIVALDSSTATPSPPSPALAAETVPKTHTVVRGDNLWRIAEHYLDDGFRWVDIWKLNMQQPMVDGGRFVDPDLIYPGWVIQLPQDARALAPAPADDWDVLDRTPTTQPEPEPEPSPTPRTPEPTSATPTTTPSPIGGAPVATPTVANDNGTPGAGFRTPLPGLPVPDGTAAASIAGIAVGGLAMLLVFRRIRRRETVDLISQGERRPVGSGDAGRVLAIAAALRTALVELDFGASQVVLVRESQHYLEFTLGCPPGDAGALVESRHTLGRRLGCAVDGVVDSPTSVRLKMSRMSHLATSLFGGTACVSELLVPVGASDSGIFYLNIAAVGSVIVAGGRLQTRELVAGWIESLASLNASETLVLTVDARAREHLGVAALLLPGDAGLLGNDDEFARWARGLEETLMEREEDPPGSQLLAVMGPADNVSQAAAELDGVMRLGPPRGVYLVALTESGVGAEDQRRWGASVVIGDGGDNGDDSSGVILTIGQKPPLELEPVVVRRQVAYRPPPSEPEQDAVPPIAEPSANGHHADAGWLETEEILAGDIASPHAEEPVPPTPSNGANPDDDMVGGPGQSPSPAKMDRQSALPLEEEVSEAARRNPPFQARLFGAFQIETEKGEVTGWSIQKSRELLAYLLAHGGAQVLRESVAETLWRGAPAPQAMHQLSNAAHYLRRTLNRHSGGSDPQLLAVANGRYHLRPGAVRTDVDAFDAHLARADRLEGHEALIEYERALALYGHGFLAGETFEWADVYRREYQARFASAAQRAARIAMDGRDPKLARRFYETVLKHDPIDEEAFRGLLGSLAAIDDKNAARHAYRKLVEALQEALDDEQAEPMPTTAKLFSELLGSA